MAPAQVSATGRAAAVHGVASELLRKGRVGAGAYSAAEATLGPDGVAALVALVAHESGLALATNAFENAEETPWDADAALLTDAELASLVAAANARGDADTCLEHGCDPAEARKSAAAR